ncbi:MAG: GIY-YIG nuclease family protein [Symploca sp. SIO1A3]|nr:GIY-YIG nuclease family protein [Symploca sp. SIO1A3]
MSLSENSIDPQVLRIKDIPQNREGWVYLIHAVGTNRYKIGRSINPVARYSTLQKQSPYPLQIIDSFWTVDMIADEAWWHEQLSEYRAYGEWFEFKNEEDKNQLVGFEVSSRIKSLILQGWFLQFIKNLLTDSRGNEIANDFTEEDWLNIEILFSQIYDITSERYHLERLGVFITHKLPERIRFEFGFAFEEFSKSDLENIYFYTFGLLEGFMTALKMEDVSHA